MINHSFDEDADLDHDGDDALPAELEALDADKDVPPDQVDHGDEPAGA